MFNQATFSENALFSEVTFTQDAEFDGATFAGDVKFSEATFTEDVLFGGATVRHSPPESPFNVPWPAGWRPSSDHTAIEGREGTWHHLLEVESGPDHSDDSTSESAGD
ncbi:pentapeptide repeat-containing protein [Saccharothrix deserti]|uniref:pentapeptide repeat-containing protein n=1 Tax=Saccharothrix deserti TaxID=2593674 RepID=UPI00236802EF|nr:pentapeptide repeat-containing protein [Saccharothrix deserti]